MAYTLHGDLLYGTRQPTPTQTKTNPNDFLNQLGFGGLIGSAKSNIANLLHGLPSADQARTENAYFGVQSGMPGSDYVRNRGYDLYNQKAQNYRQAGMSNLTDLLGSVTSPTLSNQAQQLQNQQFQQQLGQSGSQFNQNLELQQFLAQLQAIGLGNQIVSSNKQSLPNYNL